MDADQTPTHSAAEARKTAAVFAHPVKHRAVLQLLTAFAPFIIVCAAMYLVFPIVLALVLALPAGMLMVRIFIVQYDCGHGSFFASLRAGVICRLCGLLTLTPYANWARQHSLHHANWSNLDQRKGSDLHSAA
jgi:omega-6 fatty acid desaturase (delta-12 desaturase)